MSASIELQRAAALLMEAACTTAAAEWMTNAELRADMLADAERDIAEARRAIDKATPLMKPPGAPETECHAATSSRPTGAASGVM